MRVQRRFAIIGHRAQSNGKLNLNDLAGASGRMDVLVRAVSSALFISHGMRKDCHITLHLMGGPGVPRRIWFDSRNLIGLHVDDRAIAGRISKILREPSPARGQLVEFSPGLWHSGGDIGTTLDEWEKENVQLLVLDADAPLLSKIEAEKVGFILSDDLPFSAEESDLLAKLEKKSIGQTWLQGHSAITVVHHILDQS